MLDMACQVIYTLIRFDFDLKCYGRLEMQKVTEIIRDGDIYQIRTERQETKENQYAVAGFAGVGMNGKVNRSSTKKVFTAVKTKTVITVSTVTKETAQKALNARIENVTIERYGENRWVARVI